MDHEIVFISMYFICKKVQINAWINVLVSDFAVLPDILNTLSRGSCCEIIEIIRQWFRWNDCTSKVSTFQSYIYPLEMIFRDQGIGRECMV